MESLVLVEQKPWKVTFYLLVMMCLSYERNHSHKILASVRFFSRFRHMEQGS